MRCRKFILLRLGPFLTAKSLNVQEVRSFQRRRYPCSGRADWHLACRRGEVVEKIGFIAGVVMVLIVEDDPLARRALKSLFAANGCACVAVDSAEDALQVLGGKDHSGLALIDIDLPGMNGIQLMGRLRELYPKVACTLMSANDYDFSDQTGKSRVPFLAKPLDLNRLLKFLRGAANGHSSASFA